jgi:hypothetical protein
MSELTIVFLFAMFTPGIIRGAFCPGSSPLEVVIWGVGTIIFVLAIGWIASMIFGTGLVPWIAMILAVIGANLYALKGAVF